MKLAILGRTDSYLNRLRLALESAGYQVSMTSDMESFVRLAAAESVGLMLVDWSLTSNLAGEPKEAVRTLRDLRIWFDNPPPMVILRMPADEETSLAVMKEGADDALVGELGVRLVVAKCDAMMRHVPDRDASLSEYSFGRYRLIPTRQQVEFDDQKVTLTKKEFELVRFLFQNRNRVLSRRLLLNRVWGLKSELYTRTVDAHMSRLRKKLGLGEGRGWNLLSVYGRGYQLEAPDEASPSAMFSASMGDKSHFTHAAA